MGNDRFQLRCFREINFTHQLMNILCREDKSSNHSTGGTIAFTQ